MLPTESDCCAHISGNEVSGAFYGLAVLQPDSLVLGTEQRSDCGQSFPSESTCWVGLYLQLLGLRSQAGIWSRGLCSLKPGTREPVRVLEEPSSRLRSDFLFPSLPRRAGMSSFLGSEKSKCNEVLLYKLILMQITFSPIYYLKCFFFSGMFPR